MTDLDRLKTMLRAHQPCVLIVTDEEEQALRLVRDAAMALSLPIKEWSVVRGLGDSLLAGANREPDTENPAGALYALASIPERTICVMLDLVGHLADERTLRAARELIQRFASDIENGGPGGHLVLIDHRDDLPSVLSSYTVRLELTLPGEPEIQELVVRTLRRLNKEKPIELSITKRGMEAIVQNLRGLTARQVEWVIGEAVADDRRFKAEDLDTILARKRQLIRADGLLEFVQAPASMDEIGGLARLKQWLDRRRGAMTPDGEAFGLPAPRGVLMLGVQGAGKSLCAKAIATAWRRPLLRLDPSALYDRYVGESERRLRDALNQAEMMAPIVLWVDEIEKGFASAASRSTDGGLSQRMFGTLLTWLQERREPVFVAATANDIEALPPELLRKGRFDEIFFIDLPGDAARRAILEIHLRKRKRDPVKFDLPRLVKACDGYSGAEIEQGVIAAMHDAFAARSDLTTALIESALVGSPPLSVTMSERVAELRAWARDRCVPAE